MQILKSEREDMRKSLFCCLTMCFVLLTLHDIAMMCIREAIWWCIHKTRKKCFVHFSITCLERSYCCANISIISLNTDEWTDFELMKNQRQNRWIIVSWNSSTIWNNFMSFWNKFQNKTECLWLYSISAVDRGEVVDIETQRISLEFCFGFR